MSWASMVNRLALSDEFVVCRDMRWASPVGGIRKHLHKILAGIQYLFFFVKCYFYN